MSNNVKTLLRHKKPLTVLYEIPERATLLIQLAQIKRPMQICAPFVSFGHMSLPRLPFLMGSFSEMRIASHNDGRLLYYAPGVLCMIVFYEILETLFL